MQRIDENRVANYIRKHKNFKKWLVFVLCLSLLPGTLTFYMMNKPATALTESGSESVGMVLETADSEYEQSVLQQTLSGGDSTSGGSETSGTLVSTATDGKNTGEQPGADTSEGGTASPSVGTDGKNGDQQSGADTSEEGTTSPSSGTDGNNSGQQSVADASEGGATPSSAETDGKNDGHQSGADNSGDAMTPVNSEAGSSTGISSGNSSASDDSNESDKAATGTSKGSSESSSALSGDASTSASSQAGADPEKTDAAISNLPTTDQTEFTYEDEEVSVKAVTKSSGVLPEGTELRVTKVDRNTEGYNYDAYMEALNNNAEEIEKVAAEAKGENSQEDTAEQKAESDNSGKKFDESNTLLYDIAFICDEKEFQPAEGAVTVSLEFKEKKLSNDLSVTSQEDVTVVHLPIKDEVKEDIEVDTTGQATEIKADDVEVIALKDTTAEVGTEEKVEFSADDFSVFAVVRTVIEKTVLASDGRTYQITVTCGENSGIPKDADIKVSELSGDEYRDYVERAAASMNVSEFEYARVFDITIVDSKGAKIQPVSPVDVSVTLLDVVVNEGSYSVVHFEGEGEKETPCPVTSDTEGNVVTFAAESFSAYAIVQGPTDIPVGWHKVASIEELTGNTSETKGSSNGFYIGHKNGYYFGNTTANGKDGKVGIAKTKPAQSYPGEGAAKYYFESKDESKVIAYCLDGDKNKLYVCNEENSNNLILKSGEENATAFTVTVDKDGIRFSNDGYYWNMQGGNSGNIFFCYKGKPEDNNNYMNVWYNDGYEGDPYLLGGKTYGLMNWAGGVAGKAMMASSAKTGALDAKSLTVMSKTNYKDRVFAPNDSDITKWTLNWVSDDNYTISTETTDGTKYLKIGASGLSLVSNPETIRVIPGNGVHDGEICFKSGSNTLTYSGTVANGFSVNGDVGSEWLKLVEDSELTQEYFRTYSAKKVSVSDNKNVSNASKVIVYTRSWNEKNLKYDYYAIDKDGGLVTIYESGDSVEWLGRQLNEMLWSFTEYYWEGTTDPNYYYELCSVYKANDQEADKYIAPQITGNQVLSPDTIGINLNGRKDGHYYSTILAWDDAQYQYVGLKVDPVTNMIVPCPKSEAMDFYFATIEDLNVDDNLNTVETINNDLYGITMKIVDFNTKEEMGAFLGGSNEGQVGATLDKELLSTELDKEHGYYPKTRAGRYLNESDIFGNAKKVNHLFIKSTYDETGYFTYDSAQNYAVLKDTVRKQGDFKVYKELGSYDSGGNKPTLKHGQFFPFNELKPGTFATVNGENLYAPIYVHPNGNFEGGCVELSNTDPRKHERLYSVEHDNIKANTFFGLELEASFTQTPNGLDEWGHDIIFEFTGDDDFWLYVDNELVIDLGGIHSAVPGNVNFRTGVVNVNNESPTTLKDLFAENLSKRENISKEDALARINDSGIFKENSSVFNDNTIHTMRIFYMERGASASNLHMRFNLTAVKKGTVQLTKELSGVEDDNILAEFPYQIWYKKDGEELPLTNSLPSSTQTAQTEDSVTYKDSIKPVKYKKTVTIGGKEYTDVFFLKPGETADIRFPEGMTEYRIVECGVNTDVFSSVSVNGKTIAGTTVKKTEASETSNEGTPAAEGSSTESGGFKDFGIEYATTDARSRVKYTNEIDESKLGTLTITKKLYTEDGTKEISATDNTPFTFRLYLTSEFDELDVANMQTYYVKDPQGVYCRWNANQKKFEQIVDDNGNGISDYSNLTPKQRKSPYIAFTTSIYGTIDSIRAGYTIEFRNLLIGTQYRVEERPGEIPDGYSFWKYEYSDKENAKEVERGTSGIMGVQGVMVNDNAHVDICNKKGFGICLTKIWQDADYMAERAPAYFALFTGDDNNLSLVDGSVRELSFEKGKREQTIYWHLDKLPDKGKITDYKIREVVLGGDFKVENGVVSDYSSCNPVNEGGAITLKGKQNGGTEDDYTYTVHYSDGKLQTTEEATRTADNQEGQSQTSETGSDTIQNVEEQTQSREIVSETVLNEEKKPNNSNGGNVLEFEVTNSRAGIVLKKEDWVGNPLKDAVFTLANESSVIGTYTSDKNGLITTAYLEDGTYTLTETYAPKPYQGLDSSMTFIVAGGTITKVNYHDTSYFRLEDTTSDNELQTLVVKNRKYSFKAVKKDKDSKAAIPEVKFELYMQKTVGDVTAFENKPVQGFDALITDENGIIPNVDNEHLSEGTYELREVGNKPGYAKLDGNIQFTISPNGTITLGTHPDGVELKSNTDTDGILTYELEILNTPLKHVSFKKVDITNTDQALEGAQFDMYGSDSKGNRLNEALYTGLVSDSNGLLTYTKDDGKTTTVFELQSGKYYLVETKAPQGYLAKVNEVEVKVDTTGVTYKEGTNISSDGNGDGVKYDEDTKVYTLLITNTTGFVLPATGGPGAKLLYILGSMLILLAGASIMIRRKL